MLFVIQEEKGKKVNGKSEEGCGGTFCLPVGCLRGVGCAECIKTDFFVVKRN